jgi:hypothetical protein
LRLLNRETQPGHLEKLGSDSPDEALVARLALGSLATREIELVHDGGSLAGNESSRT